MVMRTEHDWHEQDTSDPWSSIEHRYQPTCSWPSDLKPRCWKYQLATNSHYGEVVLGLVSFLTFARLCFLFCKNRIPQRVGIPCKILFRSKWSCTDMWLTECLDYDKNAQKRFFLNNSSPVVSTWHHDSVWNRAQNNQDMLCGLPVTSPGQYFIAYNQSVQRYLWFRLFKPEILMKQKHLPNGKCNDS